MNEAQNRTLLNREQKFANFLLFLTALIWGLSFSAQKEGMKHIGPLLFNALRFFFAVISLIPLLFLQRKQATKEDRSKSFKLEAKTEKLVRIRVHGEKHSHHKSSSEGFLKNSPFGKTHRSKLLFRFSLIIGLALFAGTSIQQIGIVYTTAGNAGFITGLYILIVPILSYIFGKKFAPILWLLIILALIGLYLLVVSSSFSLQIGDLLVLFSSVFWAIHLLLVDKIAWRSNVMHVAIIQYTISAILSFIFAVVFEELSLSAIRDAIPTIFYGGVVSVGIAFTLQLFGQKHTGPLYASLILSLEGVFAALGGWIFLGEVLSVRQIIGASLMLFAIMTSQIIQYRKVE